MVILNYPTKKALKECIGKELRFTETSLHGPEYPPNGTGTITGCNRPHITGYPREFFAQVTLVKYQITGVK